MVERKSQNMVKSTVQSKIFFLVVFLIGYLKWKGVSSPRDRNDIWLKGISKLEWSLIEV